MVKHMIRLTPILFIFALGLSGCASANDKESTNPKNDLIEISSKVYFGKWNTKGLGEQQPNNTFLVNPKDFKTDQVTIIRLSKSGRSKEVYYKDKERPSDDTWIYKPSNTESKTLIHQFKTTYMITQLVIGKDGGSLSERFEIPK